MSEGTEGHTGQSTTWWKSNQGAGLISVVFFTLILLYIIFLTDYARELRDGFLLGYFPIFATCLCIGFSALIVIDQRRKFTEESLAALDLKFFFFVIAVIGWSGIFFWCLVKVGFVLTGPIYMFGLIYAMGLRPAKSAFLVGLGICTAVFVIFALIGAPMPIGPEWVMEALGLPVDWGT